MRWVPGIPRVVCNDLFSLCITKVIPDHRITSFPYAICLISVYLYRFISRPDRRKSVYTEKLGISRIHCRWTCIALMHTPKPSGGGWGRSAGMGYWSGALGALMPNFSLFRLTEAAGQPVDAIEGDWPWNTTRSM